MKKITLAVLTLFLAASARAGTVVLIADVGGTVGIQELNTQDAQLGINPAPPATAAVAADPNTAAGEVIRVEAVPDPGFTFVSWSGNLPTGFMANQAIQTIPIDGSNDTTTYSFTATFMTVPASDVNVIPRPSDDGNDYLITIENLTAGTSTNSDTTASRNLLSLFGQQNDNFLITAVPLDGHAFRSFAGAVVVASNAVENANMGSYAFQFNGTNQTYIALFARNDEDSDNDGIMDNDEIIWGLDPDDPADANEDPDMDGLTNVDEINGVTGIRRGPFTSSPVDPDTDGDGMIDSWESYFGLDPNDATGANGPNANNETEPETVGANTNAFPCLPGGDVRWNAQGMPTGAFFTNIREYQFWAMINGGETVNITDYPTTFNDNSTDPFLTDSDGDGISDGYEVAYGTEPVGQMSDTGDNGPNGNPDGDMIWNPAPNQDTSGQPVRPYRNIDEFNLFCQSLRGATNPNQADTDNDGMPDGWEYSMSLLSGFDGPSPTNPTGNDGPNGNFDGDMTYNDASGSCQVPYTNLREYEATFGSSSGESGRSGFSTHPNILDIDGDELPDEWELSFDYDPWLTTSDGSAPDDGQRNPDNDYMADIDDIHTNGNEHLFVYTTFGFDPRTAWVAGYDESYTFTNWYRAFITTGNRTSFGAPAPNTRPYNNRDEVLGTQTTFGLVGCPPGSDGTNPRDIDTDGDGIHDGWEFYTGFSPHSAPDATTDWDGDGLSQRSEFGNFVLGNLSSAQWFNKVWPTDPSSPDTDDDGLPDGNELTFAYGQGQTWGGHCFYGGGLNPTSCDTDGDHIPDYWEWSFPNGSGDYTNPDAMEGTVHDADSSEVSVTGILPPYAIQAFTQRQNYDYDNDGVENYQEYFAGAVWHWQAGDTAALREWFPGGNKIDYDPAIFFTGQPQLYDWHFFSDVRELQGLAAIPFTYIEAGAGFAGDPPPPPLLGIEPISLAPIGGAFSSMDPTDADRDLDELDDFWECFHGLNPIYGGVDRFDARAGAGLHLALPETFDVRVLPYVAGHPFLDVDQDALNNAEENYENLQGALDIYLHSDPSPHWTTDVGYQLSWPNLYYEWITFPFYFADGGLVAGPTYLYSFEANEGFDTDNDVLADKEEALGSGSPGSTDLSDSESPLKQAFIYFDGDSALRTFASFNVDTNVLENFTIECWIKSEEPVSGGEQTIIERPVLLPAGNIFCGAEVIQMNFRIGINPDGTPFTEYSSSACDPFFVRANGTPAFVVPQNEWVHLAAVYDATIDSLSLYFNGDLAVRQPSAVRPANGFVRPFAVATSPMVIGASDRNPAGSVTGSPGVLAGPATGATFTDPDLTNFYKGWVDEVRVWTNALQRNEINANMLNEFNRSEAFFQATQSGNGLLFHYNFNDVPDPDHSPVTPNGFDALTGRPNDGSYPFVPWWGTAPDRSQVYNDYNYVTWVENVIGHLASFPAGDTSNTNASPNSSNPYNWVYTTALTFGAEDHPELSNPSLIQAGVVNVKTDLLPLRNAVADRDIEGWTVLDPLDLDEDMDGLPDDWEELKGLDPTVATGPDGADGDPDLDGLTNITEYEAGTDPNAFDSDGDRVPDHAEDFDQDGLTNLEEQDQFNTRVNDPDTDDDGFSDGDEVDVGTKLPFGSGASGRILTSPTDSRAPLTQKSLVLSGTKIPVPHTDVFNGPDRFMMRDWTIEAWIWPASAGENGSVIRRTTDRGERTFDLLLENNVPRIEFTSEGGVVKSALGYAAIPAETWTHLAASWDNSNRTLAIYVNGLSEGTLSSTLRPALGSEAGETCVGDGINGFMDELRFFQNARNPLAIQIGMFTFGGGAVPPSPFVVTLARRSFLPHPGINVDLRSLGSHAKRHMLVQFKSPPTAAFRQKLFNDGVGVVNYINPRTYILHATLGQLNAPDVGITIRHASLLEQEDKLAEQISTGLYTAQHKMVLFYPGVSLEAATAAVEAAGGTVAQEKYFDTQYLAISANHAATLALADSDIVSFIIPSTPLANAGQLGHICPGPRVDGIQSMPFTTVSEGWDGPGRGRANLTWFFKNFTSKLGQQQQKDLFAAEMDKWASVAALTFSEAPGPGLRDSFDIEFAQVDGPFGILAFAYFPNPPNPETIAGDMTFDDADDWADTALYGSTALHEAGHALGLGHSADPTAIMFAFVNGSVDLNADDIAGIQTLYGDGPAIFDDSLLAHYPFDDGVNLTHPNPQTGFIIDKGLEDFQARMVWEFAIPTNTCSSDKFVKIVDVVDSDEDGLADWWEMFFYGDLNGDGFADDDGDGLLNFFEYLADTDPRNRNTDNDPRSITDDREDRDMDGLPNIEEQVAGTDPNLQDTDDDGLFDITEINNDFDPVSAVSPLQRRVLALPGDADSLVEYPAQPRFTLESFSIEAWVNPATFASDSTVIERQVAPNVFNYFLRINTAGVVFGGFTTADQAGSIVVAAPTAIPLGQWTHVQVNYDLRKLWLVVNGIEVAQLTTGSLPALRGVGPVRTVVGPNFAGMIDNVAIWNDYPGLRTLDQLDTNLTGSEVGLVSYLRFDDGTNVSDTSGDTGIVHGQIQDFVSRYLRDWERCWQNAATLNGGSFVNGPSPGGTGILIPDPRLSFSLVAADCPIDESNSLLPISWNIGAYVQATGALLADTNRFWHCVTDEVFAADFSVRAGGVFDNGSQGGVPYLKDGETSFMETQVVGPGEVCFAYRVETEELVGNEPQEADYLRFLVNGAQQLVGQGNNPLGAHGSNDWVVVCVDIPAGRKVLRWEYAKDMVGHKYRDSVWMDDFAFSSSSPDSDNDGLPDAYETDTVIGFGTNPNNPDTDGDGMNDGLEVQIGTNPKVPEAQVAIQSIIPQPSGQICLEWNAIAGVTYQVQKSFNLGATWQNGPTGFQQEEMSQRTAASSGNERYCDILSPEPGAPIYRVLIIP